MKLLTGIPRLFIEGLQGTGKTRMATEIAARYDEVTTIEYRLLTNVIEYPPEERIKLMVVENATEANLADIETKLSKAAHNIIVISLQAPSPEAIKLFQYTHIRMRKVDSFDVIDFPTPKNSH